MLNTVVVEQRIVTSIIYSNNIYCRAAKGKLIVLDSTNIFYMTVNPVCQIYRSFPSFSVNWNHEKKNPGNNIHHNDYSTHIEAARYSQLFFLSNLFILSLLLLTVLFPYPNLPLSPVELHCHCLFLRLREKNRKKNRRKTGIY